MKTVGISDARKIIAETLTEADEMERTGAPSSRRPGRAGGPPEPAGRFSHQERDALKNILIADMLNNMNRDPFYTELAQAIMAGKDPEPGQIQHFLDEGPRFYDLLPGDAEKALLDKLMG